jgi:hypothetical protein
LFTTTNNTNIFNRQSDAPIVSSELEKALEYGGVVYIDSEVVETGSEYPYGTSAKPVNNALDAKILGDLYGISDFRLSGTLYLAGEATFDNFEIIGAAGAAVWSNGQPTLLNGRVKNCVVSGDMGINSEHAEFYNCHIVDGTINLSGEFFNCGFQGAFTIAEDKDILAIDCYSDDVIKGTSILTLPANPASVNNTTFHGFRGKLKIQGFKGPDMIGTLGFGGGSCIIDDTNTDGNITISGFPFSAFVDESNGTIIDTTSLLASQKTLDDVQIEIGAALEAIEFGDKVIIDMVLGEAGTDYPLGTRAHPVNNLADAITIADRQFIRVFNLHSDLLVDQNMENYRIEGVNGGEILSFMGVDVRGTYLYNLIIAGSIISDGQIRAENCQIAPDTYGLSGAFKTCGILGDITIVNPDVSAMINCFTAKMHPSLPDPTIFMGGVDDTYTGNWSFVNFSNGVKLANLNNAGSFIDFNSTGGNIEILPSCIDGTIRITGVSENTLDDNSNGTTVLTDTLSASAVQLNTVLTTIDYDGKVVVDIDNGFIGTDYPIGTEKYPSNNIADAHTICHKNNIYKFVVKSDLTIDENMSDGYIFIGKTGSEIITLTGKTMTNSGFENVYITGDAGGTRIRIRDCKLNGLTNFQGAVWDSIMLDDIHIVGGSDNIFMNCYTMNAASVNENTSTPTFYLGELLDGERCNFNIRGWHGSLQIENMDNPTKAAVIHADAGFLIIGSTCTDGFMYAQGIKSNAIVDLSSGTFFLNESEHDFVMDSTSKQTVREAMNLASLTQSQIGSVENYLDRIDKNTQK